METEWRKMPIGEIAEVIGGGTPSTKDPNNFDGDVPWLTPKDLSGQHDRYIEGGERSLSTKGLNSSSARLLPKGAVLLSSRAPIGYVAMAANEISTNQGFRSLVLKDGVSPDYVYYWLKENTEALERYASGSTFKELSGSSLKKIQIPLPPENEQRAIAHVLGTLDDKIALNRRMGETLESMARALFKSWFVDFDPVRAKLEGRDTGLPPDLAALFPDRLVDSELGEIPEGWETGKFDQLVEVNPRMSLKRGTNIKWLGMRAVPINSAIPGQTTRRDFKSGSKYLQRDTLMARITPSLENGKTVLVDFLDDGEIGAGSTEFLVLRGRNDVSPGYVYCAARDERFRAEAIKAMTGTSGRQRVPPGAVRDFELAIPPLGVLTQFGRIIEPIFERLSSASRCSQTLAALRDALLPKLISGEVRVEATGTFMEDTV